MRVIRDEQLATWTFVPVEEGEAETVKSLIAVLKAEDKLSYGGRRQDGEDDKFCSVLFYFGAHKKIVKSGNLEYQDYFGGIKLVLWGSTEEDKHEINSIRDTCFYGRSASLTFLREAVVDGLEAIVVTGMRCKFCGSGMNQRSRCEWGTCSACAERCEHSYEYGAIHGGGLDIGVGEFCGKCGLLKPKVEGEREMSQLEHHLAVERDLGIPVFYEGFPGTPQEAVQVERLARRHKRSKSRS